MARQFYITLLSHLALLTTDITPSNVLRIFEEKKNTNVSNHTVLLFIKTKQSETLMSAGIHF